MVSKKFRHLVEDWDSIEHTFVPVSIRCPDGEIWDDQYFLFFPSGPIADGIVVEQSDVNKRIIKGKVVRYGATRQTPRLMWRREKVGERHLWFDQYFSQAIVVSDAFYDELKSHGIKGFQAHESRFLEV